jgi:hypothetical protein
MTDGGVEREVILLPEEVTESVGIRQLHDLSVAEMCLELGANVILLVLEWLMRSRTPFVFKYVSLFL